MRRWWRLCLCVLFTGVPTLVAGEPTFEATIDKSKLRFGPAPKHFANLRVGASSTNTNGRPTICLETLPIRYISLEACGTGQGFLHHEPGMEMAHFRAKWKIRYWELRGNSFLGLEAGSGFAELQVGEDKPGFVFRDGTADPLMAAAGSEWMTGAKWLQELGSGFDMVVSASFGMAWILEAERLADPHTPVQPFAEISLGVGW